jgi:hypothetical protein
VRCSWIARCDVVIDGCANSKRGITVDALSGVLADQSF